MQSSSPAVLLISSLLFLCSMGHLQGSNVDEQRQLSLLRQKLTTQLSTILLRPEFEKHNVYARDFITDLYLKTASVQAMKEKEYCFDEFVHMFSDEEMEKCAGRFISQNNLFHCAYQTIYGKYIVSRAEEIMKTLSYSEDMKQAISDDLEAKASHIIIAYDSEAELKNFVQKRYAFHM